MDPAQRHEGEMAADIAFLHPGKLRLICLDVNVDILQLGVWDFSRWSTAHKTWPYIATNGIRAMELAYD